MFSKMKIALSVALVLGAASVALANDSGENHQDEDRSVTSITAARTNPWLGKIAYAGGTYGYVALPTQKQRPAHKQGR
jgi:hypothetical protein